MQPKVQNFQYRQCRVLMSCSDVDGIIEDFFGDAGMIVNRKQTHNNIPSFEYSLPLFLYLMPSVAYFEDSGIGVVTVKETGFPDNVTHSVNGSEPSCSLVAPFTSLTVPGSVRGSFSLQVLSFAVIVTPVMLLLAESIVQLRFGLQASRFMRERNVAASYRTALGARK